jgi:hypothetical protein
MHITSINTPPIGTDRSLTPTRMGSTRSSMLTRTTPMFITGTIIERTRDLGSGTKPVFSGTTTRSRQKRRALGTVSLQDAAAAFPSFRARSRVTHHVRSPSDKFTDCRPD